MISAFHLRTWLLASLTALSLTAPAAAQVLACPFQKAKGAFRVTIDQSARTLTVQPFGPDGSAIGSAFRDLPAQFSDESIVATWRHPSQHKKFVLNRYSGVLRIETYNIDPPNPPFVEYTRACERLQRGPRKF